MQFVKKKKEHQKKKKKKISQIIQMQLFIQK